MSSESISYDFQPLPWSCARARLRHILQTFVDEAPSLSNNNSNSNSNNRKQSFYAGSSNNNSNNKKDRLTIQAIDKNVDLYSGLVLSISTLVLASFSLSSSQGNGAESTLHAMADLTVYRGQLAAAILLLMGSLFSLWIVRRSTFLRANDSEKAKKREVLKFLKTVQRLESECASNNHPPPNHHHHDNNTNDKNNNNNNNKTDNDWMNCLQPKNLPTNLSETALCDIYPVYRQLSQDPPKFLWTRLPSLLLVEGDFVALQIGDACPADCTSLESPRIHLKEGDRVSLDSLRKTATELLSELPRGRTSLPEMSERLLLLCNNVRIFCVKKAPIRDFIQRPAVSSKPSQMWRQMRSIRAILLLLVPIFFLFTAVVILLRPDATQVDLSLSLPLPLLAALGVAPLVAPSFMFFLEVVGTSRILRMAHPHALGSDPAKDEDDKNNSDHGESTLLLWRYILATILTRLSLWQIADFFRICCRQLVGLRKFAQTGYHQSTSTDPFISRKLLRVPPASSNLVEKLGVCTAFTLVDDELAYELNAIPQQLLIPSGHGLKLLDLCPVYDDEEASAGSQTESLTAGRARGRYIEDSDSEDSGDDTQRFHASLRQKILKRRVLRRRSTARVSREANGEKGEGGEESAIEVQFEDPGWWKHLPALKGIGLSCLLVEEHKVDDSTRQQEWFDSSSKNNHTAGGGILKNAKAALINLITAERRTHHLSALAECIGFSRDTNANGERGDLTPFEEQLRLQVVSKTLLQERLSLDSHERSSEQSRWWGHLRADSTSVIVKDKRTGAYQLLTVGDPHVVTSLCSEAWQGEIQTILPLGPMDRQTIVNTCRNWKLADLDVAAFGYAPVPHNLEKRLKEEDMQSEIFLLDSSAKLNASMLKDKNLSRDWGLIRNQVFLGMLGSLVVPRREIPKLLAVLDGAGVRFVYFSPRNMRRQKELASQMGIDVAWNCAISLRPLGMGEDDPHRMVSTYADWDVNAKLPHGVEEVRRHLEEVDNVPLLVSLYTDTTKERTKEMVEVFQEYHDTVLSIGIAHLPKNNDIFSVADIAVGIDVLGDKNIGGDSPADQMMVSELEFASGIASHSCAFRFRGVASLSQLPTLIEQGRAALEAGSSAAVFLLCSSLSFSFYVLFAACAPSTTLPHVPTIGAAAYLQFLLPLLGLSMAMTNSGDKIMKQVPPKNDLNQTFAPREGFLLYQMILLKALLAALLPQLLWLIAFGELVIEFDPDLVQSSCGGVDHWYDVIRCDALKDYSGPARVSAGIAVFTVFIMTWVATSVSFLSRYEQITVHKPWQRNDAWVVSVLIAIAITGVVAGVATEEGTGAALPWYFYIIAVCIPILCLIWNEYCKSQEAKREIRAENIRRLQFETRLGMWSPKDV